MEKRNMETIIRRISFLIPFILLAFIASLILFCKWVINYVRFGGEYIGYTKKTERKTIQDTYELLTKILVNEEKHEQT